MKIEKEPIIEFIRKNGKVSSKDVADLFGISRQAAHGKLNRLALAGELIKVGRTRGSHYVLPAGLGAAVAGSVSVQLRRQGLKEHEVLEDVFRRLPALADLKENVQSVFRYAFSEMLNNAIEHSGSDRVAISAGVEGGLLVFEVRDFGIGVFRNVMKKYELPSETAAIAELLKGKTTTAPKAHSGEGIFFTSKIADMFLLESFGFELLVANTVPDVFVRAVPLKKGTLVRFSIAADSDKHLIDLFRQYESGDDEHRFDKTKIFVKLYTYGTIHVSRSQARRILEHIPERFTQVILDFDQVPSVGQAFADEIFRVFKARHPEILVEAVNANEAVRFMIDRVEKP